MPIVGLWLLSLLVVAAGAGSHWWPLMLLPLLRGGIPLPLFLLLSLLRLQLLLKLQLILQLLLQLIVCLLMWPHQQLLLVMLLHRVHRML